MNTNINIYGYRRLIIELKTFIKQLFFIEKRPKRNVNYINNLYEQIRDEKNNKLNSFNNVDDYFLDITYLYPNGDLRLSLLDNKIVYGKANDVAVKVRQIIENVMKDYPYKNVIELGSGGGKNLLWFASRYKHINFIGLELSATSVKLSTNAAQKFGINNVQFFQCDLTKPETYQGHLTNDTFIYSHHTLEEMPRIYKIPLLAINDSNVKTIALLEPVYIFKFSRFLLDLSKLLRIYNKDRLFGLKRFVKNNLKKEFNIEIADLGLGVKPANPTTLVLMKRK